MGEGGDLTAGSVWMRGGGAGEGCMQCRGGIGREYDREKISYSRSHHGIVVKITAFLNGDPGFLSWP